ncbi:LysR family transcriptional regulator ArgP [Massilia sp. YIM B02443]|uniref:LysR family transcriptional regulator ArgP n=1 Tax=Massilia sp. YIM B02443 TaxID=3050127 RepID=UPI0025B64A5A|nr:LysR family transcriptional regulator ArgP [Massilia sp. YIM B02443]MDN4037115.1 LysR family transcriptional regulator ArgP [Massilia sp. YIM B02443]
MKLDPRRSSAFLAAVDAGSLELVATRLNITPSAVSQRISALEQDLGTPLLVRSRPCRPTVPGTRLLQYLRRSSLLESEFLAGMGMDSGPARVTLAVTNDTLATWLLPVLAPILEREGLLVEFILDDQGHTFALLEAGQALAGISGEPEPMHGCSASALGVMRYRLVASPAFRQRWFADGVSREAARHAPVMVFNRKDALQASFLLRHFDLPEGAYPFHYVPASDPYVNAIRYGLGYGLLPLEQCARLLASGELVDLTPQLHVDVPLYWHAWRIQPPRLERMGAALVKAAHAVLLPIGPA